MILILLLDTNAWRRETLDLNIMAREILKLSVFHENGLYIERIFEAINRLHNWIFQSFLHGSTKTKGREISNQILFNEFKKYLYQFKFE